MRQKLDTEAFRQKATLQHGGRYAYECSEYTRASAKVCILCPEHGEFWQAANMHLRGHGCPRCGSRVGADVRSMSTEDFIRQAQSVHRHEGYDYSRVCYVNNLSRVRILCPLHGEFEQRASNHLLGRGCPRCAREQVKQSLTKDVDQFLREATAMHQGKYNYQSVQYNGAFARVEIRCPEHGAFLQTPDAHLNTGAGCPLCCHRYSQPHQEIEAFLRGQGVRFRTNDRTRIAPYELDILVEDFPLGIEFNGQYWHSLDGTEPSALKFRHREKFLLALQQRLTLLQIDEHEWNDPVKQEIWKSILLSKLGKHDRIYARNTQFKTVTRTVANRFLAEHHLQGATPAARWCFGLYHDSRLVGVITFAEHEKRFLNLTRLAFPRGLTVVGGAQKLFKNALPLLPERDIVTFSNNQYSRGDVYAQLGFTLSADLPPSYQWYFRSRVWNKRHLRRSFLPAILGEGFNAAETEHANLYRNRARCLYDAGYRRWIYERGSGPSLPPTPSSFTTSDSQDAAPDASGLRLHEPAREHEVAPQ